MSLLNDRSMPIQPRRGTATNFTADVKLTTVSSELVVTTDDKQLYLADGVTSAFVVNSGMFTVTSLPAAGVTGRRALVSDASGPTFLSTVSGGASTVCPVFDNGSAWKVG